MGSSAKKKKEKKKDFQKTKLKVGKARPKPSNLTDTSFRSKGIVLKGQSLSAAPPSLPNQFAHHFSLLSSRSDAQRRDSLAYLTTAISSRAVNTSLPQPVGVLLPKLLPLALDGSNGVRGQLLKILQALPARDVEDYAEQILLYVRAGMTHLAADIRAFSMDLLGWALDVAGSEIVACPGGWVKTLRCFLSMLGWSIDSVPSSWSSSKATFGKAGAEGKVLVKNMTILGRFLLAGTVRDVLEPTQAHSYAFPLHQVQQHMITSGANSFGYLRIFGNALDEENSSCEDREDRLKVLVKVFQPAIELGVENGRKEGGEVGRAAAGVSKVLYEAMRYSEDELEA